MEVKINGSCLCGTVQFSVLNQFSKLYLCHCHQCRQITGSAFAANLFVDKSAFSWEQGTEEIKQFQLPEREISKSFCQNCGSGVPYLTTNQANYLIPAGCLKQEPDVADICHIFCAESTQWEEKLQSSTKFEHFPETSNS